MNENDHDLRWPPWPQQWLLLITYHVIYQKKGNDFSIRLFNFFRPIGGPLTSSWQKIWPPWPQQWLFRFPCHVTYQMKGNDFSILPCNVLDQLDVIWPHHDRKCYLKWPPWPQQWLLLISYHVTYQRKGNDFSIRLFNFFDQLEVLWPDHDRKDDLHDHNNDFFVFHVMWCDISNER